MIRHINYIAWLFGDHILPRLLSLCCHSVDAIWQFFCSLCQHLGQVAGPSLFGAAADIEHPMDVGGKAERWPRGSTGCDAFPKS